MAKTLEVRGRFDATYADYAHKGYYGNHDGSTQYPTEAGTANTWESARIVFSSATGEPFVGWPGRENWSTTQDVTMYFNILPNWSGTPSVNQTLVDVRNGNSALVGRASGALAYISTSNQFVMQIFNGTGGLSTNLIVAGLTFTSATPTQLQCSYAGATGAYNFIQDGNTLSTGNNGSLSNRDHNNIAVISVCGISTAITPRLYDLYLLEIYDSIEGDLTTRTGFDSLTTKQPENWTSITAAEIKTGVNQVQAGNTQTGTFIGDWTTITAAQIQSGVNQVQNGNTVTGTYLWTSLAASSIRSGFSQIQDSVTISGSFTGEIWSTITAAQIQSGVNQVQNSVTITGTLNTPAAIGGTVTTVNIPQIKEQIRFVLADNNTTTSAIQNLSAGMSRAVEQVAKINPEKIPLQPSIYPCVTISTDNKNVAISDIAIDQATGKRRTTLTFKIWGITLNTDFQTNIFNDPADQDLEILMENIESILRNYPDLGDTVKWQIPNNVAYHSTQLDDGAHIRVGELTLEATLFY